MTTLDELKLAWEAHDRKLDASLRLSHELLRAAKLNRVRSPLRRLVFELSLEIAASVVGLFLLGNFLAQHITEGRFVWPAAMLDVWLILCIAASIRQLVQANRIDYDEPVTTIQRQLGELRILRLRAFRLELLTGQIVWWLPFFIVALKLLFGVDAYRFLSTTFIVVNLLFGLAIIPLAIWITRRLGHRIERSAFMRRLADEIAGRSLTEAQTYMAKLSDFEKD
jgi:hypothetical protein